MKTQLTYIFILLNLIAISGCNEDEEPAYTLNKLTGYVQKGPYINGTAIIVSELNENLNPTGKTFSSQIFDNKGSFEVNEVELISQYVEIRADGFYFDEITGQKSDAQLTLFGLADISDHSKINVNILTQLEKSRVEYLSGTGLSFAEAKVQAQAEVLNAFEFEYEDMKSSELLDISQGDEENAILLAISLIFQSNRTVADLTEFIANISMDLKEDGVLNSEILKSELVNQARYIDTIKVRKNLETRYESMGVEATIPDFEKYLRYYIENENPIKISYTIKDISCNGQGNGEIGITMEGGTAPFIFQWSNDATTEDISNLSKGIYWVSITDANNYKYYSNEITINEPEMLLIEVNGINVPEVGNNTGTIDISVAGGTLPYAFQWSNGSNTEDLINLALGGYAVNVIDANNCSASKYVPLINSSYIVKDVTCSGVADGEIDLTIEGGTPPYSFQWSNGATTEDISNLSKGIYWVSITDANNYKYYSNEITINEPEMLLIEVNGINVPEVGNNTGTIDISVAGGTLPYAFQWSNGSNTEDLINLALGGYAVNVIDANNCSASKYVPLINSSYIVKDVTCSGVADGEIDLTIEGGTPPYSFQWSNGATTEDISNLSGGSYSVTVTETNNYEFTLVDINIYEPDPLLITENEIINILIDNKPGSFDITVTGGTPPYTFLWSGGETSEDIANLFSEGKYSVTVGDANICSVSMCFDLFVGFKDIRDGTEYRSIKIGNQTWMAENLSYLPSLSIEPSETEPCYNVCIYQGTNINQAKATSYYQNFGVLYNYPAAMEACPIGWHLPTNSDWDVLINLLGGQFEAGYKMKEGGKLHWSCPPDEVATNESGFTGLPGGILIGDDKFQCGEIGKFGFWWCSDGTTRILECIYEGVGGYNGQPHDDGCSVRCIKD